MIVPFYQSDRLVEGHYCIGLRSKNNTLSRPNSRVIADQHALSLKKKFLSNSNFMKIKGYAVEVPEDGLSHKDGKV